MLFKLMGLEIKLRRKYYELFIQAGLVQTEKMILSEVLFQTVVVKIVLRLTSSPITDKTPFVFLSAVDIKLVLSIKSLATKSTFWVAFESRLVNCTRIIISLFKMPI